MQRAALGNDRRELCRRTTTSKSRPVAATSSRRCERSCDAFDGGRKYHRRKYRRPGASSNEWRAHYREKCDRRFDRENRRWTHRRRDDRRQRLASHRRRTHSRDAPWPDWLISIRAAETSRWSIPVHELVAETAGGQINVGDAVGAWFARRRAAAEFASSGVSGPTNLASVRMAASI